MKDISITASRRINKRAYIDYPDRLPKGIVKGRTGLVRRKDCKYNKYLWPLQTHAIIVTEYASPGVLPIDI